MANRILAAGGRLLPVTSSAFNMDQSAPGVSDSEMRMKTGYATVRAFYESLGIMIGQESAIPGWYECRLPEGYQVEFDQDKWSRDESVGFIAPDDSRPFKLITYKDARRRRAHVVVESRVWSGVTA